MSKSSAPSPKNSWVSALVLALAAGLGIPTGIIAVSTHFVNEHPWWSLVITLAFAVVVFVTYEVAKLWQRLEGPLLDAIAERVKQVTHRKVAGYDRRYCQYVINQHRDFDVKGLTLQGPFTLELDQVFIELSIDPTTVREMSASPLPQSLREGGHTIWDYLASEALAKQQLVVVGPPGSGKTTLLKYIALRLVASHHAQRSPASVPNKWPLLLFLRDHAKAIADHARKGTSYSLQDALLDHLRLWDQPLPPPGWIERLLSRGDFLVMLDGLDEVADAGVRQEVVNWVRRQVIAYSQNRFLVTSRPGGYRNNPLESVALLEVRPFTPEQVERFIYKWYLADETMRKQKLDAGVEMRARAEAKGLLQQLYETPALLDLTVNPLLLAMIAIVHRYGGGGKLPEKRVGLYEDICKVFLGKRQEARRQELLLRHDQMQLVLEPLAYFMLLRGTRDIRPTEAQPIIAEPLKRVGVEIAAEQFLKLVENVSGLLLEQESGVYWFAHKTFEEFLAATHITKKQLGRELTSKIEDVWWQETIRLCCAMSDATPIIAACLAGDRPSLSALLLALDCLNDAREVQPEVRARLTSTLEQGLEDTDIERRHLAADVLLTRRLREMAYLNERISVSTSYVTCAEYQLFLDKQRVQGNNYQPDHWITHHFPPGQARGPALGMRASDAEAFCDWLTERERSPWRYRLPRPDELDEHALSRFVPGTGFWLRRDGVTGDRSRGFKWVGEPVLLSLNFIQNLLEQDFAHARAHDLALALDRALARDLALDRARADLLYIILLFIAIAERRKQSSSFFTRNIWHRSSRDEEQRLDATIERIINAYFEVYFALLLLDQRIEGRLPACEGIVVVKERM